METKPFLELLTFAYETQSTQQNQRKRKFSQVSTELTLSCNSPNKKMHKTAKRQYEKIIMANTDKTIDLSDGTRNLLHEASFSGIKTERFVDGEYEVNIKVSTELSLSLTPFSSLENPSSKMESKNTSHSCSCSDGKDDKGISTNPSLFDPWKIKKKLTMSDLGGSSRLLMHSGEVKEHLFPIFGVIKSDGINVRVWDCDTRTVHNMVLKQWESSKAYIFMKNWNADFVKRKGLKENDIVGLYWDIPTSRFNFSLLQTPRPN